ncbi:MAG: sigma-70 family RNA polymerase sigma factor [Gammaproteobacteria bacterium]|nr:sigma-70 family RNA polymerase sigma factor [Gammaproteobacteria bacterium]
MSHPDRDALLASVYDELRRAAARMLGRERNYLTLQATELVNEAAMRVMQLDRMEWADRRHMFATASRLLRQAMIDAIRKRRAGKRQLPHVTLGAPDEGPPVDIDLLDGALTRLEAISPELAQVVEQRYFVGLSIPEIAAVSGQSERTISRRWQTARAWLSQELGG